MTATAACLCVLAAMLTVPLVVGRGSAMTVSPGRVIALWAGSVLLGAAALMAAALSVLVPVPLWQRAGCTGCASVVAFATCSAAALLLGAGLALLAASAEREWRRNDRLRTGLDLLLSHPSTVSVAVGGRAVHLVSGTSLGAASVRMASGGVIVLDRSFVAALEPRALRAVVEHERAHLDLRHDRIRFMVRVVHGAFPWFPGATACARRVELMVEAAADDRAAAVAGERALCAALSGGTRPVAAHAATSDAPGHII